MSNPDPLDDDDLETLDEDFDDEEDTLEFPSILDDLPDEDDDEDDLDDEDDE